ncbi:DUF3500 domain-containing protein [Pirellulaceae bacterium SH449]
MKKSEQNRNLLARRQFLATTSAVAASSLVTSGRAVFGSDNKRHAETVVGELFQSLSPIQRDVVCKSFTDPLRQQVSANWHVVKPLIGSDFFSKPQQSMAIEIVRQLTSPEGFELIKEQTDYDDGGIEAYSMAWFGQPGDDKFEWMLTGRHLTLRADGNTQEKVVFGGPITYGHGEESAPEDNLFYFQTKKFNEVFGALNESQRKVALLQKSIPSESQHRVQHVKPFVGLSAKELSDDQLDLLNDTLTSILGVYREEDCKEARELLEGAGGLKSLYLQYYANDDMKSDGVWDMWRIVGENICIHFRGAPHVHAFIHIQNLT